MIVIKYQCGHFGEVEGDLFNREIAQAAQQKICPDCVNKELNQDKSIDGNFQLAKLTGSIKQQNWAFNIRMNMLDSMTRWCMSLMALLRADGKTDEQANEIVLALYKEFWNFIPGKITDAAWYINRRNFGSVKNYFGKELIDLGMTNNREYFIFIKELYPEL